MPLILSSTAQVVISQSPQTTKAKPVVVEQKPTINVGQSMAKQITENQKPRINTGTQLFVNGKERKIGKKSQYLLDMLTLEE